MFFASYFHHTTTVLYTYKLTHTHIERLLSGTYESGLKHGFGVIKFADGNVYEGNFVGGFYEGLGMLKLANGEMFKGEFKKAKKCGFGVCKFKDGHVYEGMYRDDKYEGTYYVYICVFM